MELHHHDKKEVLKCWRLHLGCSSLTSRIIKSVSDKPGVLSSCDTAWQPVREWLRRVRRRLQGVTDQKDSILEQAVSLGYSTLLPFVTASLFYLEQVKNIAFAVVLFSCIMDYSSMKPFGN